MTDARLLLISANKNRIGNLEWSDDDYDVRHGAPDGRHVGRIYKLSVAPTGLWWFWAVQIFPAMAADVGRAETRDAAMIALKAQWLLRREAWEAWVSPSAGKLTNGTRQSVAEQRSAKTTDQGAA